MVKLEIILSLRRFKVATIERHDCGFGSVVEKREEIRVKIVYSLFLFVQLKSDDSLSE